MPCSERRKQLPLLRSVRLSVSRALVRVTHVFYSARSDWSLVIGESLHDPAAHKDEASIRSIVSKASRLMLQLTRSTVEDSVDITVKPPPRSRLLSGEMTRRRAFWKAEQLLALATWWRRGVGASHSMT